MKKFFAGVLVLALMVSGVLCGCSDEKSTESQIKNVDLTNSESLGNSEISTGFTYTVFDAEDDSSYLDIVRYAGGVVITGYVGNDTDIVIPEQIDGRPVIGINDFAFCPLRFTNVEDEDIQEFIESGKTFSKIKSIQIPATVIVYGEDPFFFCDSLETVKIYGESNAAIYHIGKMFNYCYSLKTIEGTIRYINFWDEQIYEMPFEETWVDYEEPQETTEERNESLTSQ